MKHCPYLHRYLGSVLGIMLWISTWHANQCMVIHRPLWGQALWQDLWELGHQKQITVYHVTRHAPLASPRNDEADTLAKVRWLEMVPIGLPGREVAKWLHCCLYCCLLHAEQKTMWSTIKALALPITLAEVQEACEACFACSREHPWRPVEITRQVEWGQVSLTQW